MAASFIAGALAGYAIAIPVGAIAILILDLGIRRGFRSAAAAGAGAASADGLYALVAVIGGTAISLAMEPLERPLRVVAIGVLLGIGLRGLVSAWLTPRSDGRSTLTAEPAVRTYARFLGLTLLNPATVIYFAALVLAVPNLANEPAERVTFALGAFLASLSWQTTLAAIGAVAHRRLPARFQALVSVLGNLAICGFAILLASDL
ncbi:MAG: LysE family transporter [Chloroflexi bacterium]|nr:LysE family transporter [Chloroflexota bacterium]